MKIITIQTFNRITDMIKQICVKTLKLSQLSLSTALIVIHSAPPPQKKNTYCVFIEFQSVLGILGISLEVSGGYI